MSVSHGNGAIGGLDPAGLMAAAAQQAGLDDYGDETFVEPLTFWLESARKEANLSPMGEAGLGAQITTFLVNRLRFQDDLKAHPEILDEVIARPIVVVGMPRTGTTKLHRMLASDPEIQSGTFWRLLNPAPFPGWNGEGPDPRIADAHQSVGLMTQHFPTFMTGHPTDAEWPDEETFLLEMTFESLAAMLRTRVPTYVSWWLQRPRQGPYDYLHRLLRYLQWQDGGACGRSWVLKSPTHLGDLDTLAATFPDATVVHCHREPAEVIPSVSRLVESTRRMHCDDPDLHDLGQEMLRFWSNQVERNLRQREQLGDSVQLLDVDYSDICADPFAVIREVYGARGQELSPAAEESMRRWDAENPQTRFGKHDYSAERYGLTDEVIKQTFAPFDLKRFAGAR